MSWWHYLLLVNLYLVLFYGFYRVFLHSETFFQLNRVYLVGASLLSFLIPVMRSDQISRLFITQRVHQTIYSAVGSSIIYQGGPVENSPVTIGQIVGFIYITGAFFLLLRLVYQLLSVKKLIDKTDIPAFSFFNKIKVKDGLLHHETILRHEQVHSRQWHSADVLLIEAVMIINWFNPVVYFYRKAIKRVHEYIADRKVIETGTSKTEYALLLLSQTFGTVPHQLTNNFFNHSLLKQRIIMLNQSESRRRALLKYGLSAPLFAAMLVFSSATVNNSDIVRIINRKTEQVFLTRPDIIKNSDAKPAEGNGNLKETTNIAAQKSSKDASGFTAPAGVDPTNVITTVSHKDSIAADNSPVFNAVELNPAFPGGEESFGKFLRDNIIYPAKARDNNTQGRVFLNFVVEKDGRLSGMKTLRDPGNGLGEEAIRVLSASPKWMPGMQNGKPVRVQYTVPVNFSLSGGQTGSRPVDTAKAGTQKRVMVLMLKNLPDDSAASMNKPEDISRQITHIRMNGRPINEAQAKKIDPTGIEEVRVFRRDTLKPGEKKKTDIIYIRLKDFVPTKKS